MILRHFEYTDADGTRYSAMQNYMADSREGANRALAHTAAVSGWRDVEVFPADLPEHEIKKRINGVRAKNGQEPKYADWELAPAGEKKSIVILTDHEDGSKHETTIVPTGPVRVQGSVGMESIPITDHAEAQASPAPAPPALELPPLAKA